MNAIAGPVMQIGCIAFGVDLMFGVINGGTFPLTNTVVKVGTGAISTVVYTGASVVINVAGPVYGSLILAGAGLFATEYLGITDFKQGLQNIIEEKVQDINDYYSSFFNISEVENTESLAGVTETYYDI
jgi:hypothetical protein